MKRSLLITLCALLCCLTLASSTVYASNGDTIVHITSTGECYHKAGCSYLKSDIPITLEEAVARGYRRCSRCHPPTLDTQEESTSGTVNIQNATKEKSPFYAPASTKQVRAKSESTAETDWIDVLMDLLDIWEEYWEFILFFVLPLGFTIFASIYGYAREKFIGKYKPITLTSTNNIIQPCDVIVNIKYASETTLDICRRLLFHVSIFAYATTVAIWYFFSQKEIPLLILLSLAFFICFRLCRHHMNSITRDWLEDMKYLDSKTNT